MAWTSYSKRQKETSGSIITVDEYSDNDKRHNAITITSNFIEKPMNLSLAHEQLVSMPNIFHTPPSLV